MTTKKQVAQFVMWLLASTVLSDHGLAQQPSGQAVRVKPKVDASGITGARLLEAPGDVYQGDQISTSPNGQAQIEFADNSRFVVGPNSRVTIDRFVFNPDRSAQSIALRAGKGTFRFLSGNSPSGAYRINTPTLTIGVRGSAFNFAVLSNGRTVIQWLEDEGFACATRLGSVGQNRLKNFCVDLQAGDIVSASPGGGFDTLRPGEARSLVQLFSGVNRQRNYAPGFGANVPGGQLGDDDDDNKDEDEDNDNRRPPPAPPPPVDPSPPPPPAYP